MIAEVGDAVDASVIGVTVVGIRKVDTPTVDNRTGDIRSTTAPAHPPRGDRSVRPLSMVVIRGSTDRIAGSAGMDDGVVIGSAAVVEAVRRLVQTAASSGRRRHRSPLKDRWRAGSIRRGMPDSFVGR